LLTRKGVADCSAELEADYRTRLSGSVRAAVRRRLPNIPETKTGDTKQLQTACAALDEATRPLANLLMDRAMEAMLRKRGAIS
jgi:hypothetical protein